MKIQIDGYIGIVTENSASQKNKSHGLRRDFCGFLGGILSQRGLSRGAADRKHDR